MIIASIIIAIPFIVLAVVFLMGKGDKLIAGYNTASEEEKKKVDIQRLRQLMAVMMVFTAGFCGCLPFIGKDMNMVLAVSAIFVVITIVFIILANTWAKKK